MPDRRSYFNAPIGPISWNPRNVPEYVQIGHNSIAPEYMGNKPETAPRLLLFIITVVLQNLTEQRTFLVIIMTIQCLKMAFNWLIWYI